MANIFSYPNKGAYGASNERPTTQSAVSYDGSEDIYDGVNIIVPFVPSNCEIGDMVVFDTYDNKRKLLKWQTYNAGVFDSARYIKSNAVFFGLQKGKANFVAVENAGGAAMWAEKAYFRLTGFNLASGGSITFNTYYSWAAHNGNVVTWNGGANLASIAALFNGLGLDANYFHAEVLADETGIGIWIQYPTNANIGILFSITEQSGGEVSVEYMNKYKGGDVVWQYVDTGTLIPGRKSSGNVVRRNGLVTSWGGGHFVRFVQYYGENGKAEFVTESDGTPMRRATFDSLASSAVEAQKALYDKYHGSYEEYMEGAMTNTNSLRGIIGISYDDAAEQTRLLGEIMTQDFNRNAIPAFPAANQVFVYGVNAGVETGFEAGKWGLPTAVQMMDLVSLIGLNYTEKTTLNKAISRFNDAGNIYGSNAYQWTCAECSAGNAFYFVGGNGTLYYVDKYARPSCRGVLALDI